MGTRPNFVKVAPLIRALSARESVPPLVLVHAGQHYDAGLSRSFLDQLRMPEPDVVLSGAGATHGEQTARVVQGYEQHLLGCDPPPQGVIVVGDSNSTLAAALAAAKLQIPVAHVEAGLRSFDEAMPEELNRRLTDALSALLFATEQAAVENLEREGCAKARIHLVGNVMIDTLEHERARALAEYSLQRDYAYVSLHRPSNVDDPDRLERLARLLLELQSRISLVFPVHPRTRPRLAACPSGAELERNPRVELRSPASYRENLALLARARVVLTDSGGLQEETTQLGVPCLTLRSTTERPITVERGTNTLAGDALERVPALVEDVLAGRYKRGDPIPLWDGRAAERVADVLLREWA